MLAQQLITETEEAEQVSHAPVIAALFSRLSDKQLAPAALAALLRYRDELAARDFMEGNFDSYLRCVPDKQRRHFEQMCKKEKRGKHKSSHAASPETAMPSKTIKKLPDQATTTAAEVSRPDVDHSRSVPRLSSFPIAAGRSSRAEGGGGGGGGTKTRTPSLPPIGSTREAQGDRRARSLVMADTGRGDQHPGHHSDQHREYHHRDDHHHRDHHRDHRDHHDHHDYHDHHEPHQSWSVIPDIVRHSAGSGPAGHAAARTRGTRDRDTRALEDLLSPSPHPDSDLPEPNRR